MCIPLPARGPIFKEIWKGNYGTEWLEEKLSCHREKSNAELYYSITQFLSNTVEEIGDTTSNDDTNCSNDDESYFSKDMLTPLK